MALLVAVVARARPASCMEKSFPVLHVRAVTNGLIPVSVTPRRLYSFLYTANAMHFYPSFSSLPRSHTNEAKDSTAAY